MADYYSLSGTGGGIYNNGGKINAVDSNFSSNSAKYGGGIYNDGGKVDLSNSTFNGNSASSAGGGIYNGSSWFYVYYPKAGDLTVTNSTFSGNSAESGGGIYNGGGSVNVSNSAFLFNSANNGGGIYNGNAYYSYLYRIGEAIYVGSVTLTSSILRRNSVGLDGGGIYNSGTFNLINSSINGNSATNGGGLYNRGGSFRNNRFGFSYMYGTVNLINTTLTGNTAKLNGGGFYNKGESVLQYSLYYTAGTVNLVDSLLSENWAIDIDGFYNDAGIVNLTNSIISGNFSLATSLQPPSSLLPASLPTSPPFFTLTDLNQITNALLHRDFELITIKFQSVPSTSILCVDRSQGGTEELDMYQGIPACVH